MTVIINGTTGIVTPDIEVDGTTLTVDAVNDRVGIGTDSPGELLHLTTTSGNGKIRIDAASAASIDFYNSGTRLSDIFTDASTSNLTITNRQNADIIVRTNGTNERLRITSGGNVGIGTDNPSTNLHLSSGGATQLTISNTSTSMSDGDTIGTIDFSAGSSNTVNARVAGAVEGTSEAGGDLVFETRSDGGSLAERLRITSAGNILVSGNQEIYNSSSSGYIRIAGGGAAATGAYILAFGESHASAAGRLQFAQSGTESIIFTGTGGEKLRITSGGDMGLGTTAPNHYNNYHTLTINGTNGGEVDFEVNSTLTADIFANASGLWLNTRTEDPIIFSTNNGSSFGERLRITSDGKVGIGVGAPGQMLEVTNTTATDCQIQLRSTGTGSGASDGFRVGYNGNGAQCWNFEPTYFRIATSNIERLRISHQGYVTKPYQPAFNAKLSTATGAGFTGFLVFNTVDYNIGSHYNNTNGRFTAPVGGRYLFSWYTNVLRDSGAGVIWGDWYVNTSARQNRFYSYYTGGWELIGATIILNLSANDYVRVHVNVAGNYDGGGYGSFSGTLLS